MWPPRRRTVPRDTGSGSRPRSYALALPWRSSPAALTVRCSRCGVGTRRGIPPPSSVAPCCLMPCGGRPCSGLYTLCRTTIVMAKLSRSACIDTGPVGGPQAHDDAHRCATGRTAGRERCRGDALRRLASDGMCRHDPPAEGVGREGTAGMEQAAMTDLHAAIGHDVLEAPAEQCQDVEGGGAWAVHEKRSGCPAACGGGE